MATFEAQVEGLTSLAIDGSSAPTQTELTQFLTDGAKEIINVLPNRLQALCASEQTFTSGTADTLNTGNILFVTRNDGDIDQPCRRIPAPLADKAKDPDEMQYASVTDPIFFIKNNALDVLPDGGSCKYSEVQYPAVAYGDDAIARFPDEAEHLVVLYGAVRSLQNVLGDKSSNADITTALTAINTEIDECLSIADLINTQVDAAIVELAETVTNVDAGIDTALGNVTTALGRVNTAVGLANTEFDLINPEVDLANAQVDAEDVELANGYLSTARGYGEAGSKYISEAQTSLAEAQGYTSEISSRTNQISSQVGIAQGYISAAQGYANEIQSKIQIANAYANEAQTRLQIDTAQYSWYEKQQAKLQKDYEDGLAKVMS